MKVAITPLLIARLRSNLIHSFITSQVSAKLFKVKS